MMTKAFQVFRNDTKASKALPDWLSRGAFKPLKGAISLGALSEFFSYRVKSTRAESYSTSQALNFWIIHSASSHGKSCPPQGWRSIGHPHSELRSWEHEGSTSLSPKLLKSKTGTFAVSSSPSKVAAARSWLKTVR